MRAVGVWVSVLVCGALATDSLAQTRRIADPGYTREQVLGALDPLAPSGVELESIQVEGSVARVTGVADDTVLLSRFIRVVDEAEHFGTPELVDVANDAGRSAFNLRIAIECPSGIASDGEALCGEPGQRPTPVYKCRINGTISFQGTPCPPGKDA